MFTLQKLYNINSDMLSWHNFEIAMIGELRTKSYSFEGWHEIPYTVKTSFEVVAFSFDSVGSCWYVDLSNKGKA